MLPSGTRISQHCTQEPVGRLVCAVLSCLGASPERLLLINTVLVKRETRLEPFFVLFLKSGHLKNSLTTIKDEIIVL